MHLMHGIQYEVILTSHMKKIRMKLDGDRLMGMD